MEPEIKFVEDPCEYDFFMLATKEQVAFYAEAMFPLIQDFIDRSGAVELTARDVIEHIYQGTAIAFLWASTGEEPVIKTILVTEVKEYPRLKSLNIVVLSGSDFDEYFRKYWNKLAGWAYTVGVRAVEGFVSEPMARMMGKFGFEKTAVLIRQMI